MKRILILLLSIIIVISISGCGTSTKDIDSALQGSWLFDAGISERTIAFKKGNIEIEYDNILSMNESDTGTYSISPKDETIKTSSSDSWLDEHVLEFSYNEKNGEIILWLDGVQGRKIS